MDRTSLINYTMNFICSLSEFTFAQEREDQKGGAIWVDPVLSVTRAYILLAFSHISLSVSALNYDSDLSLSLCFRLPQSNLVLKYPVITECRRL